MKNEGATEIPEAGAGESSGTQPAGTGESSGGPGGGSPPTRPPDLPSQELLQGSREDYLRLGVPLYEASIKCNWKVARAILNNRPELVRFAITENGDTMLHVAASANGYRNRVEEFVKNLVNLMSSAELELENKNYNTALYLAACAGNLEIVKILVRRNRRLLTIPGANRTMMPLYVAALFGKKDVVEHIYSESNIMSDEDGWNPQKRDWVVERCVENDIFDTALQIMEQDRQLGGRSNVLQILARKPEAFREAKSNFVLKTTKLIFALIGSEVGGHENKALSLLRFIWDDIAKKPKNEIDKILRGPADSIKQYNSSSVTVVRAIQLKKLINDHLNKLEEETNNIVNGKSTSTTKGSMPLALQLENLISEYLVHMHDASEKIVKQDNTSFVDKADQATKLQKLIDEHIVNMHHETQNIIKKVHGDEVQAQKLQELIVNHITKMRVAATLKESYSSRVLFVAAEMGNTSFLVELIRKYPDLIWKVDDNNQSIFHIAVQHRHEGIYNLLYEIGAMKDLITPLKDGHGNTMLHLVGTRAEQKQLDDVPGFALQMQRELLWFQEVKNMIPPSYRERRNEDGLTPDELFTLEHKELVTQGEKWLKEIATQCMVVATLIATIVFAAAFTVPGGYDQTTDKTTGQQNGIPVFHSKTTFIVFVVADAISLFAACSSLFIFVSILTTRYAERDFLDSLPKKLILGLVTLFLSITTMMVAFGISFFVLYHKRSSWVPILICGFALLSILIYVKLQHALFIGIIRSMYSSRYLFKLNNHVLYYDNPKV